ncbi:hypothetical protein BJV78DRAFT_207301 [Lactifluus subvellereus]|nr:hypothetical protein BJV78DRAFT_207301 [Lactifluus subvellereus]
MSSGVFIRSSLLLFFHLICAKSDDVIKPHSFNSVVCIRLILLDFHILSCHIVALVRLITLDRQKPCSGNASLLNTQVSLENQ